MGYATARMLDMVPGVCDASNRRLGPQGRQRESLGAGRDRGAIMRKTSVGVALSAAPRLDARLHSAGAAISAACRRRRHPMSGAGDHNDAGSSPGLWCHACLRHVLVTAAHCGGTRRTAAELRTALTSGPARRPVTTAGFAPSAPWPPQFVRSRGRDTDVGVVLLGRGSSGGRPLPTAD